MLVAVGGATYNNWAALNTAGIRRFVDTFGLDGVDIDYEVWGCSRPLPSSAILDACLEGAEAARIAFPSCSMYSTGTVAVATAPAAAAIACCVAAAAAAQPADLMCTRAFHSVKNCPNHHTLQADTYCTRPPVTPGVQCGSDRELTSVIRRLRAALPRPRYTLTAAMWSVGAYGQGVWRDAQPVASRTGMAVNPLRAVRRGARGCGQELG